MRCNKAGFFVIFLLFLNSCVTVNYSRNQTAETSENSINSIKKVLATQAESWNNGDLEGYMQGYWQSDSLRFIGKSGLTYGWNQTLQNYRKSYPDKDTMGKLTFTIIAVEPQSETSGYVIGKWHLVRAKGDLQGHFTLLFRKFGSAWKIVADHSS